MLSVCLFISDTRQREGNGCVLYKSSYLFSYDSYFPLFFVCFHCNILSFGRQYNNHDKNVNGRHYIYFMNIENPRGSSRGVGDKPMSCKPGVAGSIPDFR